MTKPSKTLEKLRNSEAVTLVAIGDSLTYGWMVSKGYLDFFKEMLSGAYPASPFKLINKGIPGDTAAGGTYRLESDVFFYQPDCMLVQFALNDAFSGYTPDLFGENVETIIRKTQANTEAEIVLVTSVYLGENDANKMIEGSYYARLEKLAGTYGLSLARVHEHWKRKVKAGTDFEKLVQFDMVHPTVLGYKLMAEAVMAVFAPE